MIKFADAPEATPTHIAPLDAFEAAKIAAEKAKTDLLAERDVCKTRLKTINAALGRTRGPNKPKTAPASTDTPIEK